MSLSKPSKTEFILLAILIMLGFALRAWNLSLISLDHFDEGVYLFSGLGISDPVQPLRLFPNQERFSPPLFIVLIAVANKILGEPYGLAALWLNVVLGTITILVIWLIGRLWFGSVTGLVAAALLSFSEFHIILSRSVLTDVSFGLLFLLSLLLISLAIHYKNYWLAIFAGAMVGLAWNTKYHGWFALAIAGIALLIFIWQNHLRGPTLFRVIKIFAVILLVAVICYLPWLFLVHFRFGGYFDLAAYQKTMINQPIISLRWFGNLWEQISQQYTMEGVISRISILIAFVGAVWVQHHRFPNQPREYWILLVLAVTALFFGGSIVTLGLALLALPILLRKKTHYAAWLLIVVIVFFGLSTPFYRPYARLVFPLSMACFLAAGLWMQHEVSRLPQTVPRKQWQPIFALIIILGVVGISWLIPDSTNPWRDARGMAQAAERMEQFIPPGERVIVLAEPALAYYLHLSGRPAFERMDDPRKIAQLTTPVYLITGRYTNRAPVLRKGIEKISDKLVELARFSLAPRDIRIMDDYPSPEERQVMSMPGNEYELVIYRFNPD